MGLIDLINNLDSTTKTSLLGVNTTRILRYTFADNDYGVLGDDILNNAVAMLKGRELVKSKREILIEALNIDKLKSLGFDNYQSAIESYNVDLNKFILDFNISNEYYSPNLRDTRLNIYCDRPIYGECNGTLAYLHDYQLNLKKRINSRITKIVNSSLLVSMPTGAGKTMLAMEVIVDLFRVMLNNDANNKNTLWLVSSKELAEQALQSFSKIWKQKGDSTIFIERYFGRFDKLNTKFKPKITFATFDLVTSRLGTNNVKELLKSSSFLFIDEAHASGALTYRQVILEYKNKNNNFNIIGLTATPYRTDDTEFNGLKNMFSEYLLINDKSGNEVKSPIKYLVNREYLSHLNFSKLNMSDGKVTGGEYYKSMHNSVLEECKSLIRKNQNILIFAKSKPHATALSIFLERNSIVNGLIVGETIDAKRSKYLDQFGDSSSKMNVLINHQILSAGIDVPGMNAIMVLSDIGSPTLALQILGRAMRGPKNGGNKNNTIYLTPSNYNTLNDYHMLEAYVIH